MKNIFCLLLLLSLISLTTGCCYFNEDYKMHDITSWNHVTNGHPTEWKNITLTGSAYNLQLQEQAEASCHADALSMIFIKKYADWNHQHSNGFEQHLVQNKTRFDSVKALMLELKINSAHTQIPSFAVLKQRYGHQIDDTTLAHLDAGLVNLGINFYGEKMPDGRQLKASIIIEIDQHKFSDQWLRLEIDMDKFNRYSELNYVRTPIDASVIGNQIIHGVNFMGETRTGLVLRNQVTHWDPSTPETFKEMDVSFKKVALILKNDNSGKENRK
jgi:hypothetical protein